MLRALPVIIAIALTVFCLIDLGMMRTGEQARNLPRWAWVFAILLLPIFGPIAWLVAGRPKAAEGPDQAGGRPAGLPSPAPDDDPAFLADLERRRQVGEREKLQKWQAELERRERDLDNRGDKGKDKDKGRDKGRDKDRDREQGLEQGLDKGKDDPGEGGPGKPGRPG